jgi:hypothetical protein
VSELITRTARLVPYMKRPKQVPSFVTAYAYEPLPDDPSAELGNLYVVLEALVSGRASEEVADLVIETIGEQYYNHEDSEKPALERFEAAVKAINRELSEHVNRGNAAWIGKLSAIVAVQAGADLHIAQTGSAEASLYRGKAVTRISAPAQNRPTTPSKTFGSIASGQVEPGDRLLLATPALIHQVPLERLQSVIRQSSPNAAIAEITALLKGASIDRIAALVIEVTTPELAALQVRSEEPAEIQLGSPETAFDAAKMVAAPIAQTTVASSRKLVHAAHSGAQRTKPYAQEAGLQAAAVLRRVLSTAKGRRTLSLLLAAAALLIIIALVWHASSAEATRNVGSFQSAYAAYQTAEQELNNGDKPAARKRLSDSLNKLNSLKKSSRNIDAYLKNHKLPEGEPKTFTGLSDAIKERIDQIDGLTKTQATTVVGFTTKDAKFDHMEVTNGTAYAFDTAHNNALDIINLNSGSARASKIDGSKLGEIRATTLSATGDGIYIVSAQPAVWLYRFDIDTLVPQTVSFGDWPKATAIASYASNLYLLAADGVYRHTKTSTGFSPRSLLLATMDETTSSASGLEVDGSVYLVSPSGLHRFSGGTLAESAPLPQGLETATNLHLAADADLLIGVSPSTSRIAFWNTNPKLGFLRQVSLTNVKKVYDAAYDLKSGQGYALVDGRLVRWPLSL